MYTKVMLEQLREQRRQLRSACDLTPDGPMVQAVHQATDARREQTIAQHQSALENALGALRQNRAAAIHGGLAKAHFNHTTPEYSP